MGKRWRTQMPYARALLTERGVPVIGHNLAGMGRRGVLIGFDRTESKGDVYHVCVANAIVGLYFPVVDLNTQPGFGHAVRQLHSMGGGNHLDPRLEAHLANRARECGYRDGDTMLLCLLTGEEPITDADRVAIAQVLAEVVGA